MNFNCLGLQTAAQVTFSPGESMLAILPVFHGFGLGVCIHTLLLIGGRCILVPRFNADIVFKYLRKMAPQYMAGVPTLYEALLRHDRIDKLDLKSLKGAFAGGDSLPLSIKEAFDLQVKKSGGTVVLREGYGLTESVTACTLMPEHEYRQGSIGIPYPDMQAKVVKIGSMDEAPVGEDGELCMSGPTLMLGYLNHPQETAATLKTHSDGRLWLHTGDICSMDEDGFIYFKLRLKRMIKCSGVSVYPSQVEEVLDHHPHVELSCAIGIPDKYQIQKIKAFIVLKKGMPGNEEVKQQLIDHCGKHLIKWSVPAEIEFRDSLPLTLVGKVDFNKLEQEELEKRK
jgi:long-chain acyl-CoA synthetase